jgi:hypothetical protein
MTLPKDSEHVEHERLNILASLGSFIGGDPHLHGSKMKSSQQGQQNKTEGISFLSDSEAPSSLPHPPSPPPPPPNPFFGLF